MTSDISVIVPCYNCEKTIGETYKSLLKQTEQAKQIIFIDDGSTDNTLNILLKLKKIHPKQIEVINQENKGVSAARNCGIKHSNTEWVAFCDSDDLWDAKKIAAVKDVISKSPNVEFIAHSFYEKYNGKVKLNSRSCKNGDLFVENYDRSFIQTSTTIIKTSLLKKVNLFDENLLFAEDLDLWLKCIVSSKAIYIEMPLSTYVVRADGKNLSANEMCMYKYSLDVLLRHSLNLMKYMNGQRAYDHAKYRIIRLIFAEFFFQTKTFNYKNVIETIRLGNITLEMLKSMKKRFYADDKN